MKLYCLLACTCSLFDCKSSKSQGSTPYGYSKNDLFDIEIQFSKITSSKGFKAANYSYASDSAVVFRPGERNALKWASEQPDSIFGIRWYPSFIDMSEAGDLGYAVGPFENHYDKRDTSKFIAGQFATVWKKQDNGSLKFIMDFGTNRLPDSFNLAKEPVYQKTPESLIKKKHKEININKTVKEFKKVEDDFSGICKEKGDSQAFKHYGHPEIRFIYQREFYVKGIEAVLPILSSQKGLHTWTIKKITMSSSGDLVHVSGIQEYLEKNIKKRGYFMRIWKKQKNKTWKIVLQVRSLVE